MKKLNLFVAVLVFAVNAFAADALTERLQRGLFEEEANRNLDAAIKEYQSVVTSADEQRKVVATALFRLGECYRKLGRTNDAASFYQRIVRDYSEQEQLAALSQSQLPMRRENSVSANTVSDPAAVKLLREEIGLTEQQVKVVEGKFSAGRAGLFELLDAKKDVLRLKRQLPESAPALQQRALIEEQIKIVQQLLTEFERRIQVGTLAPQEHLPIQREMLSLQRELAVAGDVTKSLAGGETAVTDDEEKEVRRIQAMIKDSPDLINARDHTGLTPLHLATRNGQVVVAKFLIASRADVNARNSGSAGEGSTPLHLAAARGYKSLVELLLANGADVNANATQGGNGNTPLHLAAEKGFRSVIEVLLANKADINARNGSGETPLHHAVGRGFKAIVELLLGQGADVNAKTSSDGTALQLAARISNRDLVELLLAKGAVIDDSDSGKITALRTAVQNRNLPILELLLAKKANPNLADQTGTTPLSRAVQDGAVNLLEPLLAGGADPNLGDRNAITPLHWAATLSGGEVSAEVLLKHGASVTNKVSWAPGAQPPKNRALSAVIPQGITPLGLAIGYGQVKTAQLLLDGGAEVETVADAVYPNGNTGPGLEVAIEKNNRAMVKLLLERKANPNIKIVNGWTPLIQAAVSGQKEIVELLLAHGAEVNVLAPGGWNPLTTAVQNNKPEIAELLRQHGAIEDLARSSSITVARGANRQTMFQKGTNDFNRHTLFEALAQHYSVGQSPFQFPDFARLQVRSINSKAGEPGRTIDLETAFQFTNCAANTALEWGDLIELPEQDHVMNMGWPGLSSFARSTLRQCLRKQVSIIVKGQTNLVVLTPELADSAFGGYGNRPARILNNPAGAAVLLPPTSLPAEPARPPQIDLNWQRLNDVVRNANVIRSSSDLTRVKVTRAGQPEMIFDLVRVDKATDLWLRDGDVIEVSERP